MKPIQFKHTLAIADGLTQTITLDAEAPDNFVCCYAIDGSGAPIVSSGTVVFEIATESCPFWVDIEANGDWAAPVNSGFRAPATRLRVTISAQDAGVTHFVVAGEQYNV